MEQTQYSNVQVSAHLRTTHNGGSHFVGGVRFYKTYTITVVYVFFQSDYFRWV